MPAIDFTCPICSITTPAGQTHICPIVDRDRPESERDPNRVHDVLAAEKRRKHKAHTAAKQYSAT